MRLAGQSIGAAICSTFGTRWQISRRTENARTDFGRGFPMRLHSGAAVQGSDAGRVPITWIPSVRSETLAAAPGASPLRRAT